jgi:hypothetical protein
MTINMTKKDTKKNNKKEPVKAVIVPEAEDANIGDVVEVDLTLVDEGMIPKSIDITIPYENGTTLDNRMTFTELYNMKKCVDILLSNYDNLIRLVTPSDKEYHERLAQMNKIKAINNNLMNKIEEKVLNTKLC